MSYGLRLVCIAGLAACSWFARAGSIHPPVAPQNCGQIICVHISGVYSVVWSKVEPRGRDTEMHVTSFEDGSAVAMLAERFKQGCDAVVSTRWKTSPDGKGANINLCLVNKGKDSILVSIGLRTMSRAMVDKFESGSEICTWIAKQLNPLTGNVPGNSDAKEKCVGDRMGLALNRDDL